GLPPGATFDPATRTFSWTPTEAQGPGSYNVTFSVSDGSLSASETVKITVLEVNLAPTLAPIVNRTTYWGDPVAFTASAADPDLPANPLTFALSPAPLPPNLSFDTHTGAFAWTPTAAQVGTYTFTARVTDDGGLYAEQSFTVTVKPRPTTLS